MSRALYLGCWSRADRFIWWSCYLLRLGIMGAGDLTEMHSEFCATSLTSRQFSARVTDRRKQAALRVSLQRRQVSLGKHVSSGRRVPTGHPPTRLRSSAFKIAGSSQAARNRMQHLRSPIGAFGKDRRRVVRSTDVVHL